MDISYFIIFIISIIISLLIAKYRNLIANTFGVYDIPNKRKIHKEKVPTIAGFSVALLFILFLIQNIIFKKFDENINIIFLSSLFFFLIGLLDDKLNISPYVKIILLSIIILISLKFSNIYVIKVIYFYDLKSFFNFYNYSIPLTVLCILLLVNAFNLADGINGLAIGISIIWLLHLFFFFKIDEFIIFFILIVNLIIIFINNIKNKYFLGDAGSLMISSFIAYFTIYFVNKKTILYYGDNFWIVNKVGSEQIFILFMIPGLDMLRLFIFRILNGNHPFAPDKNHLHHLLIEKFNLHKTLIIYFILINLPIFFNYFTNIKKLNLIIFTFISYSFIILFLKKR